MFIHISTVALELSGLVIIELNFSNGTSKTNRAITIPNTDPKAAPSNIKEKNKVIFTPVDIDPKNALFIKQKKRSIFAVKQRAEKRLIKIGKIELPDFPLLLAPMEDVSDPPFRMVCKEHGADLMYTEFISSEGLIRDAAKSRMKLDIYEYERPIGVQIFGSDTETMVRCAEIIEQTNPDLLDINYGCPVLKVTCKGAGAGILKDIPKMVSMTEAIVKATSLPVTVKTRLGWDEQSKNVVEVAERLQDIGIQALTIHGRTRVQMYKGEADWTLIAKIKENSRMHIPVFGNGDITTPEKALEYKNRYGIDGIMIGRASIGYPWIFNEIKHFFATGAHLPKPTIQQRAEACRKHFEFSLKWKGNVLGVLEMRRHYSNYFKGLPNFKDDRMALVTMHEPEQIQTKLQEIVLKYDGVEFLS